MAAGQLELGLQAQLDAIDLVVPACGALRVRLIGACAGCENLLGPHDAAHARLLRALDELDDHGSADAAALQIELAADAIFDSDFTAMGDWAQQALVTARTLNHPGSRAVAAALACFANYTLGRPQLAEIARLEAVTTLDGMGDDALAVRLDAPYYLGYAEYFCERYDDAIRHLQRGIAVSRACGQGQFLVPTMVGLAFSLEVRGRLAEAADTAVSAVEAARLAGNRQLIGFTLVVEAWTAAMSGNLEQAVRAGEEALASIEGLDESVLTRANRETVAAAFIAAGDPERGLRQAQLAGAPDFAQVDPGRRCWLYAHMAQAELALGRRAAAEDWLVRGERTTQDLDLPLRAAEILGRRTAAPQRRGAGGAGLDALSGREREIADLVAHGHTNRRIATQQYLSEKTVESHLTKVFAKLRVSSRAEVAERIGRSRPLPS